MASIYIETFGCQMNEADSQYVADRATSAGYAIVTSPEDADVLVLNTCTVRDNAERRAYGRMNHFKVLKDADPSVRLVVMGCLAEQDRDRMQSLAPHVDAVFGTRQLRELGDRLVDWEPDFDRESGGPSAANELAVALGGTPDAVAGPFSHLRAFVNVQRGCSYYCTFCIVPHVRGRFDHRPMADVLRDVEARVAEGAREVMLVGQTVNAWNDPVSGTDFGDLCRAAAAIEGLERLAFISPHPKDFTAKIIRDLAAVPQCNPRMHLPLQSFSDPVLRRMNRKYTAALFAEKVAAIRQYLPNWAITTDIIVGFPGETESDFMHTLEYVRSGVFANAFTFMYSIRRGTPAANWEQVPHDAVTERFGRLVDAQNAATRAYHDRKLGTTVRVLIAGDSKKDAGKLATKATDNVTVVAPKPPGYDEASYASQPWLDVRIESAHVWGCMGTIVGRARRFDDAASPVERPMVSLL
ncbi:MAG TPA: tRNA (N6-isopentenyl adenosine(37)-C2)-methylthiotransferase MiaB [Candidatus Tumulicola sp.]|jgi:tRNA-2-methylthio-N6-dimethylallyladenosine synthase